MNLRAVLTVAAGCVALSAPTLATAHDAESAEIARLSEVLESQQFEGEVVFSPSQYQFHAIERVPQSDGEVEIAKQSRRWPWASVTKQVVTVLIMQEVESGRIDLDRRASRYLRSLGKNAPTVRELLQHRSGLRNPDDSPADGNGVPDFYSSGPTGLAWCLGDRGQPGGDWRYNNCDYIVIGALLERVTGKALSKLIEERIGSQIGWSDTRLLSEADTAQYRGQTPDYDARIVRYGASAGLVGPLDDMLRFDRAFFGGTAFTRPIFSKESRDIMWDSDPALGYMALGQWVFEAPLAGCEGAVKIVERRGAIGKYQLRNLILPESKMAVAIATDKEGFEFGEIWTGSGITYNVLSALACP